MQFYFCQAQPKLQVKLNLKAELALFLFNPATHPPHPVKVYLAAQFQPILTVASTELAGNKAKASFTNPSLN
jgi:hypothetical protein